VIRRGTELSLRSSPLRQESLLLNKGVENKVITPNRKKDALPKEPDPLKELLVEEEGAGAAGRWGGVLGMGGALLLFVGIGAVPPPPKSPPRNPAINSISPATTLLSCSPTLWASSELEFSDLCTERRRISVTEFSTSACDSLACGLAVRTLLLGSGADAAS